MGWETELLNVRIEISIMAVPKRRRGVAKIIARLKRDDPFNTSINVSWDVKHRGCLWNSRQCWTMDGDPLATHVVVIQDDANVCNHFISGATSALQVKPHEGVSFFLARKALREARERGRSWVRVPNFLGGVGLSLPKERARQMVAWSMRSRDARGVGDHDDCVYALYCKNNFGGVWCTVPSLLDHAGVGRSVLGHSNLMNGGQPYMSQFYVGAADPRLIDWYRT